jgi:serine/threonine protein kinase
MAEGEGTVLARRYRLHSKVGHGGMGTVWHAHDEFLDRDVAVKEVRYPPGLSESEREVLYARTLREARSAARLSHPGIVTVHDVVEEDGRPWIVMALVKARSLQEIIDSDGPLPAERVAEVGVQLLAALRVAHQAGVLHRDVKPSNVLLQNDSGAHAVLTDFGIATMEGDATLTQTGMIMGSPAYIAPERVRGEKASPAADLWALGATLYAACEGHSPHDRSDAMAALSAVLTQDPPPPRNAGPLAPILLGLLVKDPARRATADQAFADLTQVMRVAAMSSSAESTVHEQRTRTRVPDVEATYREGSPPSGGPVATFYDPPPVAGTQPGAGPPAGDTWIGQYGVPQPVRQRSKLSVLLAVAALVVVAAGVVLYFVLNRPGKPGPIAIKSTPPAVKQTVTSPAPSSPSSSKLPGYHRSDGPLGSSMEVPPGWQRTVANGNAVKWTDPGSGAFIEIDTTGWEDSRPMVHWQRFEASARDQNALPGLQQINLTDTFNWRGWDTSDLEYTWHSSALGSMHGYDRGFTVNGQEYALFVAAPEGAWATIAPLRNQIYQTFRP